MSQSPSITSFTSADLPILADFLHTSKLLLAINRFLILDWPNEPAQRKRCTTAIQGSLDDPNSECLKAVDITTGDILGFAVLARKNPLKYDYTPKQECPDFMNPKIFESVMQGADDLGKSVQGLDRYEITYIYVKPSHRRNGIASKLLVVFKDRCRAEGLPLCTQSEPAAYQFFLSQGFKDKGHCDFDLAQWAEPNSGFGVFRLSGIKWVPE